ncbi:hypothetical protein HJFPF1_02185 [Paramyrothecium foliicola]|nr:hypothetical protein HJFPF1_02185 [Paramyrothecium foliicola]
MEGLNTLDASQVATATQRLPALASTEIDKPLRLTRRALFELTVEQMKQRGESTADLHPPTPSLTTEGSVERSERVMALVLANGVSSVGSSIRAERKSVMKELRDLEENEKRKEEQELQAWYAQRPRPPSELASFQGRTLGSNSINSKLSSGARSIVPSSGKEKPRYLDDPDAPFLAGSHSNHGVEYPYSNCMEAQCDESQWNHSIEFRQLQDEMLEAAKCRPENRKICRTSDFEPYNEELCNDENEEIANNLVLSNSSLPADFPRHRRVKELDEFGTYIAASSYTIALGGPPLPDLNYGIIIVPTGDESLLFSGHGDHAAMPADVKDAVYTQSKALRQEQESEIRQKTLEELANGVSSEPELDDDDREFYRSRWLIRKGFAVDESREAPIAGNDHSPHTTIADTVLDANRVSEEIEPRNNGQQPQAIRCRTGDSPMSVYESFSTHKLSLVQIVLFNFVVAVFFGVPIAVLALDLVSPAGNVVIMSFFILSASAIFSTVFPDMKVACAMTVGEAAVKRAASKSSKSNTFNFKPILRIVPEDFDNPEYCNESSSKTVPEWQSNNLDWQQLAISYPERSNHQLAKDEATWRKLGHPPGLHLLFSFNKHMSGMEVLTTYCCFKDQKSLTTFCDNLGLQFKTMIRSHLTAVDDLEDNTWSNPFMNPSKTTASYLKERECRTIVDVLLKGCDKPCFLPIVTSVKEGKEADAYDMIDTTTTILCAATQVLLFAPTSWDENRVYSRDRDAYPHRFPIADRQKDLKVAGLYSVEDLHRAICLVLATLSRRAPYRNVCSSKAARENRRDFPGYFDPEADVPAMPSLDQGDTIANRMMRLAIHVSPSLTEMPFHARNRYVTAVTGAQNSILDEATDTQPEEGRITGMDGVELATIATELMSRSSFLAEDSLDLQTFECLINRYKKEQGWDIAKEASEVPDETITHFEKILSDDHISNIQLSFQASDVVLDFQEQNPEDADGLDALLTTAYALESVANASPPSEDVDYETAYQDFGISKYPTLSLYPSCPYVQRLKPHQVADLLDSHSRVKKKMGIMLNNDMGLGKTKTFCSLPEITVRVNKAHNDRLAERMAEDAETNECKQIQDNFVSPEKPKEYLPTLIFNTVATIYQTYLELRENNPSYDVLVYYSNKTYFPDPKAAVLTTAEMRARMEHLMKNTDKIKTGRTIILTTIQTWIHRDVRVQKKPFVILHNLNSPAYRKSCKKRKKPSKDRSRKRSRVSGALQTGGVDIPSDLEDESDAEEEHEGSDSFETAPTYETLEQATERVKRHPNHTKQYFASELDDGDWSIHFIPRNEEILPDGNLIKYEFVNQFWENARFQYLIVDEAHMAKKVNGTFNHCCDMINHETLVAVTGTPIVSTLQDLESPLKLFWNRYGFKVRGWGDMNLHHLAGLWRPEYDPYAARTEFGDGTYTIGLFSPGMLTRYPAMLHVKKVYEDTGVPVWQINPILYSRAGTQGKWGSVFGDQVTRVVLELLSIRRTSGSRVKLPNGDVISSGADLLPMRVITEELRFRPALAPAVRAHGDEMARSVTAPPTTSDESDNSPTVEEAWNFSGHYMTHGNRSHFGARRAGALGAHDARNIRLLSANLSSTFGSSVIAARKELKHVQSMTRKTQSGSGPISKEPPVGCEQIYRLVVSDPTGGLAFFYNQTKVDPDVATLVSTSQWLGWLMATSPITTRVLELCCQYVYHEKRRVLIYCEIPWIQQMLYATLRMAKFRVNTIRATDAVAQRSRYVAEFNDPTSECQIFLANLNIMASGVNLHTSCSHGIMINFPHNAKITKHAHGRLNRIGQKDKVIWHDLKVIDTYHDYQEKSALSKLACQMSAEVTIPDWLTDTLREIVIYEIMRTEFGHPFNRYVWEAMSDLEPANFEFNSSETKKLGYAFTLVCRILIAQPEGEGREFWNNCQFDLVRCLQMITKPMKEEDVRSWLLIHDADELDDKIMPVLLESLDEHRKTDGRDKDLQNIKKGLASRQAINTTATDLPTYDALDDEGQDDDLEFKKCESEDEDEDGV